MTTKTNTRVLSPHDAIALGDILTGCQQGRKIEWLDVDGEIRKGEMRSLINGPNDFGSLEWGKDIRDAHVWITGGGFEYAVPVAHLVDMWDAGGMVITAGAHGAHNSAGTGMVRIEGHDLESLREMLSSKATGRKSYLLRVDQRGDTVAFKVNEGCWTHSMGTPQPPY